jgi:hypothetical protein
MKEVNYNIAGKLAKVAVFNPGESISSIGVYDLFSRPHG